MASRSRRPRLTPLQRNFVHEFVASPNPTIRCNATAAYKAAGGRWKTENSARATACELLTKPNVIAAIQVLQAQTDAAIFTRLVDWKTAAAEVQPILLGLARGYLPEGQRIQTAGDAATAHVILDALKEIMDRGFPKRLYLHVDPREALAKLLGVPLERLPDRLDDDEEAR